tara:strand:+ start:1663 stop:2088 length:426 start_codon:yes stop_codon:yes gene_type:complete
MEDPNIYYYSEYDPFYNTYTPTTHVPPPEAIDAMNKIRAFAKTNAVPLQVLPISCERICIRNSCEISNPAARVLFKEIVKTTGLLRAGNPMWAPTGIVYNIDDTNEINTEFDLRKIRDSFEQKNCGDFDATWEILTKLQRL